MTMKLGTTFLAAVMLAACASTNAADLTPYLKQEADLEPLPINGKELQWYAALEITVTNEKKTGDETTRLTDFENATFFKWLKTFLGVNKEVDSYSLAVKPTIGGVELPPMVPLKIDVQGNSAELRISRKVYSPWVPYGTGMKTELDILHTANKSQNFDLFTESANVIGALGMTPVNISTAGMLKLITARLDKGMSNVSARSALNSIREEGYRFEAMAGENAKKLGQPSGHSYTLSDTKGGKIATINVRYVFRRTLLEDPLTIEQMKAATDYHDFYNVANSVSAISNVNFLNPDGQKKPVIEVLNSLKAATSQLRDATTQEHFVDACDDLENALASKGYAKADVVIFGSIILADRSRVLSNREFYNTLWNGCLGGARQIAEKTGAIKHLQWPDRTKERVYDKTVEIIAKYVTGPGDATDRRNAEIFLNDTVIFTKTSYTNDVSHNSVLDLIRKIDGIPARKDKYHCASDQIKNDQKGYYIFIRRQDDLDDIVLNIWQPNKNFHEEKRYYVSEILLLPPTDKQLADCIEVEKNRPGIPPKVRPAA